MMIEGNELFQGVEVLDVRGDLPMTVDGLVCDSRLVKPGDAFVALRGDASDGHRFLADVAGRNAGVAVVEEYCDAVMPQVRVADSLASLPVLAANYYRHPAKQLNLFGVTGSNGKTTTTYLLEQIYQSMGEPIAVIGTIEYRYQDFHQDAQTTTPLPHEMQRVLREIADRGCARAAMEVSSHGLALHRVDGLQFHTAVFTNLSQDHLDFHHTMDDYRETKKRLFSEFLASDGTAVLNLDDETGRRFSDELKSIKQLNIAIERPAEIQALDLEIRLEGTRFTLRFPDGSFDLLTPLQGRHNVYNILCAVAAAYSQGVGSAHLAQCVEKLCAAPGRLEQVESAIGALVVVDYSHTPDALEKCLETLNAVPHQRILTVFGCGGDRDKTKRPQMGATALRMSDKAFVTSDNPRTEDPQAILNDIVAGMTGEGESIVIADRDQAIRAAVEELQPGDILLIAGKGHETYQILGREKIHFDDRETARKHLHDLGKGAA
ncbi:MAG: UDP-N-acetylmuramoyl-L-alanyl-D-glutamate--2,6-diaminopimelate ligase [Candidatus Hinthialibacter antarcticus]|nr:UDP-N-acetylmuramoyl-L-alanyl-D-glutamate--2,6-diaminopimelate ligase [Candidatus Hinthialibacter antarcticus]